MLIVHVRSSLLLKGLFLAFILVTLAESDAKSQYKFPDDEEKKIGTTYDAFSVNVVIQGYKNLSVEAIYSNDGLLYVHIEDLFKKLGIPCAGQNIDQLTGFIENEKRRYSVDYNTKQIKIDAKTIDAKTSVIKESGTLYLESTLFAEAFGIMLDFNFRTLTIILKSNFELPIIKQLRIEKLRNNISKLKGETIADTVVGRNYHLLRLGTVDWSVASSQIQNGPAFNNFGLGIGTEFLYGEANVSVNYSDQYKFDNRQLQYMWRWVDNDKSLIKQAQLGRISNQSISSINAPVVGGIIRNSPTTVRKASGYYFINESTEPNWGVELYINDVIVAYTKADASGLYTFKVPVVYGYTTLKLKFYGLSGEERTEERTMNVPYTVMSANEFEYSLSAGVVQDDSLSRVGKGEFNYGVNRVLTIGGGLEYLSSIPNSPFIPYAKGTIQPFSKLIINGEYAHGVRAGGMLNYYFTKDVLFEIDYMKYVEGQLATSFNANEERKVKLSVPFRVKKVYGFAKLGYNQFVYKSSTYNQGNIILSAYYKRFSTNSSTQVYWNDPKKKIIRSDLALSYGFNRGYYMRALAQYNVNEQELMSYKATVEKRIPKGNFSISYEKNMINNNDVISLNLSYDLSFARTRVSASKNKDRIYSSQSIQGSLAFGGGNGYNHASNNSAVGKGGILLYPFLDLNNNSIFDKGEQMVKLTKVRVSGGKPIFSKQDSIVRVPNLNAFTSYDVEFDNNDLDNIAWRFEKKVYRVLIDPNQFKRINVPIVVLGEVNGTVYMQTDNELEGIGRITVKLYGNDTTKVIAETLSESDGYFYYMGLKPGKYVARVDTNQLNQLELKATPPKIEFTIKAVKDGDIVSGTDFVLSKNTLIKDLPKKIPVLVEKEILASAKNKIDSTKDKIDSTKNIIDSAKDVINSNRKLVHENMDTAIVKGKETISDGHEIVATNEEISVPTIKTIVPVKEELALSNERAIYTIQLAVSKSYINPEFYKKKFKLTEEVWYFRKDGYFKYVTGKYINEDEAIIDMVHLGITGFITIADSLEIKKNSSEKEVVSAKKGMIYTIQLATSASYIDPAFYKNKFKLTGEVWYFKKDGYFKYVTGKYLTEQEAKTDLIRFGLKGFVTVVDLSK